jgi:alkylation response protein AidB-like acyl-CoA dehydrogenase
MLIEAIHRYARDDLRAAAHEAEETKTLPVNLVKKGWDLGVLQASVPEAYGGFGERSAVTGVLAAEELGWGDLSGALAAMSPALFVVPVLLAGSEEQKQKWIPPVIESGWIAHTAALIEPSFDFDPSALKTVATRDNGEYVLDGAKTYVPYAAEAEAMITQTETQISALRTEQGERDSVGDYNAITRLQMEIEPLERLVGELFEELERGEQDALAWESASV